MVHKAPGKAHRKGITLAQLLKQYPDDAAAEDWFVQQRWPNGVACPHCGDTDIQERPAHPKMRFRCRGCHKFFSVKTGSLMQGSNIGYQAWLIAMLTNLKGTSSMKLHRDLGITQKSAWYMAHRIREAWAEKQPPFNGPVEVDETFVGGLEGNKHANKKLKGGRGTVGKTPVVGARDRETGKIVAMPVPNTDQKTLKAFVTSTVSSDATVYTDDHSGYNNIPNEHETVRHGIGEYVRDQVHTNSVESFWAMFKRGHKGTYHKMSKKHLHRYVDEFGGRHNQRPMDTSDQMTSLAQGMDRKRLKFSELIADNGLPSGARGQEVMAGD